MVLYKSKSKAKEKRREEKRTSISNAESTEKIWIHEGEKKTRAAMRLKALSAH